MTREEAIDKVRAMKLSPGKDAELIIALHTLIPELRESEDERIRKALVSLVEELQRSDKYFSGVALADMLAWLEKQKEQNKCPEFCSGHCVGCERKEQKPVEIDEEINRWMGCEAFPEGTNITPLPQAMEIVERTAKHFFELGEKTVPSPGGYWEGFNAGVRECQARIRDVKDTMKEQKPVMLQWTGKNLKEVIDFTGKSPKFGEWFKSWDEYEAYVHSHDDILKLFSEDGSHYEVPVGAWIVKTPDGYNIPSRFRFVQKPAEWSEEDEQIAKEIEEELWYPGNFPDYPSKEESELYDDCQRRLNWFKDKLKSLRPQPHWKPSEVCYGVKGDPDPAGVWKPSEEQMNALNFAITYFMHETSYKNPTELRDLYEQLKKQM